tara:strand:- start:61508 stop:62287 length:780 start_codon:yes stop_codon:yes gene_type:complete
MQIEPIGEAMSIPTVFKNGRTDRIHESKIGRNLAYVAGFYLVMVFLVPMATEENSIPDLSGRANRIDYATHDSWGNVQDSARELGHNQSENGGTFAWMDMNPISGMIYAIGDLNCHQKWERSWEVNGNQMAVCTRDVGILFGFTIFCLLWRFRGLNRWTVRDTFLSILPDNKIEKYYYNDKRMLVMITILTIGLLPMAVDGFTQLGTSYESTNQVRIITGTLAGFVVGWFFCASFCARPNKFEKTEQVKLPANAKLRID